MSSTGKLTGTPLFTYTKPNTYNMYSFNVVAKLSKNSRSYTFKKAYTLYVTEKPIFSTNSTLAPGTVGQQYNTTIDVTGSGAGMEIFLKSGSSLPNGLKLEAGSNKWQKKITGTPSSYGTYTFTLTARNDIGLSKTTTTKNFTINIANKTAPVVNPISIETYFPNGTVGKAYTGWAKVSGGTGPFYWTVSGQKPSGLSFNTLSGTKITLSGTPNTSGSYNFTLILKDNGSGSSYTKQIPITINTAVVAPKITNTSLKQGQVGVLYRDKIRAAGTAPITYSISAVGLANGLRCDSATGDILGTPNKAITFNLTITARNSAGSDSKTLPVTIKESPFTQNQTNNNNKQSSSAPLKIEGSFSNYSVNKSASGSINVSGGTAPYKWTYTGTTPAGMKITSTGAKATLSGKPSKKGSNTFTIKVTDKDGKTLSKKFTVNITAPKPVITGSFSNSGKLNKSYTGTITLTKGTAPYKAAASGKIPTGLKLSIAGSKRQAY